LFLLKQGFLQLFVGILLRIIILVSIEILAPASLLNNETCCPAPVALALIDSSGHGYAHRRYPLRSRVLSCTPSGFFEKRRIAAGIWCTRHLRTRKVPSDEQCALGGYAPGDKERGS
jgi:hypothetical protein